MKKEYKVRNEKIDSHIAELSDLCKGCQNKDLLDEILTTVAKLGLENTERGDLKLLNNTLKELRYAFKIFNPYRNIRKVAVFGSARIPESAPSYKLAEEFSRLIVQKGYMVISGSGPGIMEAANKGAGAERSFGVNIRLPFEQIPNRYIRNNFKLINFKYFFSRKLIFIKESDATVLFPGGFGTHDEGFETITLLQTGKCRPRPVVMIAPKLDNYWKEWSRFIKVLLKRKYIEKEDMKLFEIVSTSAEAARIIEDYYRVYHSLRYIRNLTVIRLEKFVDEKFLRALNLKFKNILRSGKIEMTEALPEEIENDDFIKLPRLVMDFNRRDFGRLCQMVKFINENA